MWECGIVAIVYNKELLKAGKFLHQNENIIHIYNAIAFKTLEQMVTILDIIQDQFKICSKYRTI